MFSCVAGLKRIWWMLFVSFLVISCFATVGASPATSHDQVQRINYGVVFKKESRLTLSKESWLHTFQVELPTFVKQSDVTIPPCTFGAQDCKVYNDAVTFIRQLQHTTELRIRKTLEDINMLVPQSTILSNKRHRKSLLPFIGSLAKGLFGTATVGDVELLARHINALTRTSNLLTSILKRQSGHLSSFMSIAEHRTNNLMLGIQINANHVNAFAKSFNVSLLSVQQSMLNFSTSLTSISHTGNSILHELNKLEFALQTLIEGRVSPVLIPKQVLSNALHEIKYILTSSYPNFHLTNMHVSHYYTTSNFMFMRNNSKLYITLRFPISSHAHPLHLYKVISLPVPINASLTHATKLLDLPDYFAITHKHDFYTHLSSDQLTRCQFGEVITCDLNLALTSVNLTTCLTALYNNDKLNVHKLCNFRFLDNFLIHDIIELSPTSVLVYSGDTLTLDCPRNRTTLPGCRLCVITLPCQCSLSTKSLFLPPRLVNCQRKDTDVSVSHPVNLALLQEYFDEKLLKSISADTFFNSAVNMSLPSFKFYHHNISEILANDQSSHLSLKKMVDATKQDALIFKTLSESILDGQVAIKSAEPDLNTILTFSALGIGSLAIIFNIFVFCKLRNLSTALLVAQQISKSRAEEIPSFIYHKLTSTSQATPSSVSDLEKFFSSQFSWIHASVILSCLVLLFLIFVIYYLHRSKKSKCTQIVLEITSGGDCVVVPILRLSLCPSYYDFSRPSIDDVTLAALPSFKLFILYSSFTVTNKLTNQTVTIPTTFSVGIYARYKLQRILKQPFNVYVLVTHQGFASVLNGSNSDSTTIPSASLYPKL